MARLAGVKQFCKDERGEHSMSRSSTEQHANMYSVGKSQASARVLPKHWRNSHFVGVESLTHPKMHLWIELANRLVSNESSGNKRKPNPPHSKRVHKISPRQQIPIAYTTTPQEFINQRHERKRHYRRLQARTFSTPGLAYCPSVH